MTRKPPTDQEWAQEFPTCNADCTAIRRLRMLVANLEEELKQQDAKLQKIREILDGDA